MARPRSIGKGRTDGGLRPSAVDSRQSSVTSRPSVGEDQQSTVDSQQSSVEVRAIPEGLTRRVVVEQVRPSIDAGRFPIKRTVGESVQVFAAIFADGHDVITAVVRDRHGRSAEASRSEILAYSLQHPRVP